MEESKHIESEYEKRYVVYERLLKLPLFGYYIAIERCCIPEDIEFLDERFVVRARNLREKDAFKRYGNYIPENSSIPRGKPVCLLGRLLS